MPAQWSSPVRYVECDQQGVVFNAHYLTWADEASNHWWASHGLPWDDVAALCEPVVKASSLEWSCSARWGDTVEVDAAADRLGRSSFAIRFDVRVGDRTCCTVVTTYVMTDADKRPTRVPDELRAVFGPAAG